MSETARPALRAEPGADRIAALRAIGAQAHKLRATTRAADHYIASSDSDAEETASWLMSCSLDLANELTGDLDGVAHGLKEQPDSALGAVMPRLRVTAHQLQAAAKAADHFLEQDGGDSRETGTWLVATTSGLAAKLAAELDDAVTSARKPTEKSKVDKTNLEPHDPQFARRVAAATTTARAG